MYLNKKYFSAVDFSKCKMTKMGLDFNGDVSTSASGKTCQRWENRYWHGYYPVHEQLRLQKNYCRNPYNDKDLWCYTVNPLMIPTWEWCDVPVCGNDASFFNFFLSHLIENT